MHFKITVATIVFLITVWIHHVNCAVIERVVASIDDYAITQSELEEKYHHYKEVNDKITYEETLQTMINRLIILKDAQKHRIQGKNVDDLVERYIDLKIRALIRIQDKDIKEYYLTHQEEFKDKKYEDVYSDILKYLTEVEVNKKLGKHINDLRQQSDIIFHLDEPR